MSYTDIRILKLIHSFILSCKWKNYTTSCQNIISSQFSNSEMVTKSKDRLWKEGERAFEGREEEDRNETDTRSKDRHRLLFIARRKASSKLLFSYNSQQKSNKSNSDNSPFFLRGIFFPHSSESKPNGRSSFQKKRDETESAINGQYSERMLSSSFLPSKKKWPSLPSPQKNNSQKTTVSIN